MLVPAIPGWGLQLAVVSWVVPRQSWQRALWMVFPAFPGRGPLLPLLGLSLAIPGWGMLLALALVGWVFPCHSW